MEKKALIKVKGTQILDGDKESFELITPGKFYIKDNAYYVVYDETEVSGMEGTTTTIKIWGEEVSLIRFGSTSSKLNFKKGIRDVSLYNTPYGVIELEIVPSAVDVNVNGDGGDIKLSYYLKIEGYEESFNELQIKIQKSN